MDPAKRRAKEHRIIDAAIRIMADHGYQRSKMEEIAKEAGITKVTLYSYFDSKDALYFAVIYRAFQALAEVFYDAVDRHKSDSGLVSTKAIFESFFDFCERNFLFSEAMLDYFGTIRSMSLKAVSSEDKSAIANSSYFIRIQDIQNLPLKLTAQEIERGKKDGSIRKDADPMLHTIQGWTMVTGYIKLLSATGSNNSPVLNVNLQSLRELSLSLCETALAAE